MTTPIRWLVILAITVILIFAVTAVAIAGRQPAPTPAEIARIDSQYQALIEWTAETAPRDTMEITTRAYVSAAAYESYLRDRVP